MSRYVSTNWDFLRLAVIFGGWVVFHNPVLGFCCFFSVVGWLFFAAFEQPVAMLL